MLCEECGARVDIGEPKAGLLGALESIRFFDLGCHRCGIVRRSYRVCDVLIVKLAKLTTRSSPYAEQSENQLIVRIDELKDFISTLRPLVADTSFVFGILYKELADVYETLGRMDKCVEAYKWLIPIVE